MISAKNLGVLDGMHLTLVRTAGGWRLKGRGEDGRDSFWCPTRRGWFRHADWSASEDAAVAGLKIALAHL